MKASQLIRLLQKQVDSDGDLDVVVCGLDGAGYDDVGDIETVPAVEIEGSVVCKYVDAKDANRHGNDPTDHDHLIYISAGIWLEDGQ